MIGRLMRTADFERALATPACSRSVHFAVHHVRGCPSLPAGQAKRALDSSLSTGPAQGGTESVDILPDGHWVGTVVPKRHARRAVTRNMLKRQIRAAMLRHEIALAHGLWVVRLRSPFVKAQFPSADSTALRHSARVELDRLLARASG